MLLSSVSYQLVYYLRCKRLFMVIKNRITEKRKATLFFSSIKSCKSIFEFENFPWIKKKKRLKKIFFVTCFLELLKSHCVLWKTTLDKIRHLHLSKSLSCLKQVGRQSRQRSSSADCQQREEVTSLCWTFLIYRMKMIIFHQLLTKLCNCWKACLEKADSNSALLQYISNAVIWKLPQGWNSSY